LAPKVLLVLVVNGGRRGNPVRRAKRAWRECLVLVVKRATPGNGVRVVPSGNPALKDHKVKKD